MRLPNWQERFSDFGKARASMPFAWGPNDCCSFAAAAVEAMTGTNPMSSADRYSNELGAMRRIVEAGGLKPLASIYLGAAVPPLMAGVGDVVLLVNEGREMLGICNGVNVMAPGEFGMVALGMQSALAAWKI
jgi:phosphoribosylformylglycinamidine (FGAM) synthase-like amidotransferase family enzyme